MYTVQQYNDQELNINTEWLKFLTRKILINWHRENLMNKILTKFGKDNFD